MRIRFLVPAVCSVLFACLATTTSATIRSVPSPYPTIQSAISASVSGDTVRVAEGTYAQSIDFGGKNITVASTFLWTGDPDAVDVTVISGDAVNAVVTFDNGEGRSARLVGFTVENGGESGIRCEGQASPFVPVSPTISFCVITANETAGDGGGLYCRYASPRFENCTISENVAGDDGGGAFVQYTAGHPLYPEFVNCLIQDNESTEGHGGGVASLDNEIRFTSCVFSGNSADEDDLKKGGGLYLDNSCFSTYSWINNCTFADNSTEGKGGGVCAYGADSRPIFRNCIFWGNTAPAGDGPQIYLSTAPYMTVSWCAIQDRTTGGIHAQADQIAWEGTNLASNPLFVEPGDYHISETSPCADAGNAASEWIDPAHPCYSGKAKLPARKLVRNDMGAYGGPYADDWYEMKLALEPLALDFGAVEVDEESTLSVTVGNIGTYADLEVCGTTSSNRVFQGAIAGDSLVAPDDECEIDITFAPEEGGEETGFVTIRTADGFRDIAVRGEGRDPTGVETAGAALPAFRLAQNVPNPFNPATTIGFSVPEREAVTLAVYDVRGHLVRVLAGGALPAGSHEMTWDGTNASGRKMPSGVYFCRLEWMDRSETRRMLLLK